MKQKILFTAFALSGIFWLTSSYGQTPAVVTVFDQKIVGAVGEQTVIGIDLTDSNLNAVAYSAEIVKNPIHGSLSVQYEWSYIIDKLTGKAIHYRRPKLVYTANAAGIDNIQYRISNGTTFSNVATVQVFSRTTVKSNFGLTVGIIVKSDIATVLKPELDRLSADLVTEGFFVKTLVLPALTGREVWESLKQTSSTAHVNLAGAILVGRIPFVTNGETKVRDYVGCANCISDYSYMNLQKYPSVRAKNIWVSRFSSTPGMDFYGDELTLLRRALQANHDYRKGISRLPNRGFYFDNVVMTNYTISILDVWANGEYLAPHLAFVKGGEFVQETSHGGPSAYDKPFITTSSIHSMLAQARFAGITSCVSGTSGGVVNQQIFTRGGGNVLSYGSTAVTYNSFNNVMQPKSPYIPIDSQVDVNFRRRLNSGDTLGGSFSAHDAFGDSFRGVAYGDFSLRAKMTPHNEMPQILSLTADKVVGTAPLTVNFKGSASDLDGTIKKIEWFTMGHQFGTRAPSSVGPSVLATSATYTLPHNYLVRMEVEDNFKARAYKELTVVVAPTPRAPLRIDVGGQLEISYPPTKTYLAGADIIDAAKQVWLHDQQLIKGSWGWSNFVNHRARSLRAVTGTTDPQLFQTYQFDYYRKGFRYELPVGTGKFKVNLGFAELVHAAPGLRLIDVYINDLLVLSNFDIFAAVGANRAVIKSFTANAANGILSVKIQTAAGSPVGSKSVAVLNTLEVLPVP